MGRRVKSDTWISTLYITNVVSWFDKHPILIYIVNKR